MLRRCATAHRLTQSSMATNKPMPTCLLCSILRKPATTQQRPLLLTTQCGTLQLINCPHLLVRLEDVLGGDGADGRAQRSDDSVGHLGAHCGGVGVQDAEVALVTLHHQLQRAPLRVHVAGGCLVHSTHTTCPPPARTHKRRGKVDTEEDAHTLVRQLR